MHRLRALFAISLLILTLPLWRFMDMLVWLWPNKILYAITFLVWAGIFIALPIKLLNKKIHKATLVITLISLTFGAWYFGPLAKQSTLNPKLNHCGGLTFTGFFYPVHNLLTDAYADDLEIRNQLCWVRKMVQNLPEKFDSHEDREANYSLVKNKLMRPEQKYRVTLPLIAILTGTIYLTGDQAPLTFVDGLKFWIDQYTVEISGRKYSVWNWPHSTYIQFEYGLIERNWEEIIDSIQVTN